MSVYVGERVEVFWPNEAKWFRGVVREVDDTDNTYKVYYFVDKEEVWHGSDWDVRSVEEEFDGIDDLLGTPSEGWSVSD